MADAQDMVFGSEPDSIQITPDQIAASSEIDPITEAIREEVLAKQEEIIRLALIVAAEDEDKKKTLRGMSDAEFRAYMSEEENKAKIREVLANKVVQGQLNEAEVAGYKKVHEKFNDSYHNISWDGHAKEGSRTQEIKRADGSIVASLTETTYATKPVTVEFNGEKQEISSYRTVDFPTKLDNGGPLHISMAVKDPSGKNISEENALYFSAHYSKEGKLMEISSPQPVKFAGEGDNAIGYIERNGQIYTLAVTQGQYNAMAAEVQQNRGMAVNISQQVDMQAPDIVQNQQQSLSSQDLPQKGAQPGGAQPEGQQQQPNTWQSAAVPGTKPEIDNASQGQDANKVASKTQGGTSTPDAPSAQPVDDPAKDKKTAQQIAEELKREIAALTAGQGGVGVAEQGYDPDILKLKQDLRDIGEKDVVKELANLHQGSDDLGGIRVAVGMMLQDDSLKAHATELASIIENAAPESARVELHSALVKEVGEEYDASKYQSKTAEPAKTDEPAKPEINEPDKPQGTPEPNASESKSAQSKAPEGNDKPNVGQQIQDIIESTGSTELDETDKLAIRLIESHIASANKSFNKNGEQEEVEIYRGLAEKALDNLIVFHPELESKRDEIGQVINNALPHEKKQEVEKDTQKGQDQNKAKGATSKNENKKENKEQDQDQNSKKIGSHRPQKNEKELEDKKQQENKAKETQANPIEQEEEKIKQNEGLLKKVSKKLKKVKNKTRLKKSTGSAKSEEKITEHQDAGGLVGDVMRKAGVEVDSTDEKLIQQIQSNSTQPARDEIIEAIIENRPQKEYTALKEYESELKDVAQEVARNAKQQSQRAVASDAPEKTNDEFVSLHNQFGAELNSTDTPKAQENLQRTTEAESNTPPQARSLNDPVMEMHSGLRKPEEERAETSSHRLNTKIAQDIATLEREQNAQPSSPDGLSSSPPGDAQNLTPPPPPPLPHSGTKAKTAAGVQPSPDAAEPSNLEGANKDTPSQASKAETENKSKEKQNKPEEKSVDSSKRKEKQEPKQEASRDNQELINKGVKYLTTLIIAGNPQGVEAAMPEFENSGMKKEHYKKAYEDAKEYADTKPKIKRQAIYTAANKIREKAGVSDKEHLNNVQNVPKSPSKGPGR